MSNQDDGRLRAAGVELARIHAALRADLDAARRDPLLHCLAFCSALRAHHRNEDGVFPRLEAQFPASAPVLARLRAEHAEIARRIAELEEEPDPAVLDRLARELDEHFALEERELVPLIRRLR
ncbi:MAG TPA: hemerythrin domain-containing protein [Dactylosporangium sp.]|jgi:iron-sulfur cluster repair protein YtfE (RIC family)|nr:hemerythrin domain-containing protein [Dactylosporangium sp.]